MRSSQSNLKQPIVVLDRDGTLIEDRHYIHRESDVVFYASAVDALKRIRQKGYSLHLASNQSGVGRGWITKSDFHKVHRRFIEHLKDNGFEFDSIAYCFHAPEEQCLCRKPGIGLVPKQLGQREIDWERSFVVGDHVPDLGLASALGATPCLVLTGKGPDTQKNPLPPSTKVFETILEFSEYLPALISL
jgi:D-glycero-D-manno-heptose 1,7-bisphosphate phosphatase